MVSKLVVVAGLAHNATLQPVVQAVTAKTSPTTVTVARALITTARVAVLTARPFDTTCIFVVTTRKARPAAFF